MTSPQDTSESITAKNIPLVILHWRACIIRDTVLSGFELDLYSADECPFAYWYLSQVLTIQEETLKELLKFVSQGNCRHVWRVRFC